MADQGAKALYLELEKYANISIRDAVGGALGCSPKQATNSEAWPPISAYFVDYEDSAVLTVYVVSAGRLIRHQASSAGNWLTTCVPVERIQRLSEEGSTQSLTVIVELDADRKSFDITLQPVSGTEGQTIGVGNIVHAGYVITAVNPKLMARLSAFSARLRLAVML